MRRQRVGPSGGGPSTRAVVREVVKDGPPCVFRGAEAVEALLPGAGVAGVAVVWKEKMLGTVNLGLREGRVDRATLKGWAEGAAKIRERLAFYQSQHPEHKRNIQLNLINWLGQQDVWEMDLPNFFDMAVVSIRGGLGYYNVFLFTIEEGSRDLVLAAHAGV